MWWIWKFLTSFLSSRKPIVQAKIGCPTPAGSGHSEMRPFHLSDGMTRVRVGVSRPVFVFDLVPQTSNLLVNDLVETRRR